MGYGDKLMAIGDAWVRHQADPQRRRVLIGNGERACTEARDLTLGMDHFLVPPEEMGSGEDYLWEINFRSMRPYIDYEKMWAECRRLGREPADQNGLVSRLNRYMWNLDYRPNPAPIVISDGERARAMQDIPRGPFVIIEPYIKPKAPPSKQWAVNRFTQVAEALSKHVPVYQIRQPYATPLPGVKSVVTDSFRAALAVLEKAALYIGPEGGLHHGAAGVNTRAVVIYGGYVPPAITGYPKLHVNLTGDHNGYSCGTKRGMCPHCAKALNSITVEEVVGQAYKQLEKARG